MLQKKNDRAKHKVCPTKHPSIMKHIQKEIPHPRLGFAHCQMLQNPSLGEWISLRNSCHASLFNFVQLSLP